jgi:hypothetical protein
MQPEFGQGKRRSEGGMDGQRWGLPRGARSGDGGGKRGPRRGSVVRLLFWRGRVMQGVVGVGEPGRRVEEAGHEQGGSLPTSRRRMTGSGPRPAGAGDLRRARAAGRTEGEGTG